MASSSFQRNKHSTSTVIHFLKLVLRKSLEHGTLTIPKKFSRKYSDGLPNPVYLKPPDGTQWKIDWTNHCGEILFGKGWKEFAAYYSLECGHMLWFEYNGTSYIEVHIVDMSCVEIEYPSKDHINDGNSVETLNNEPPKRPRPPRKKVKAAAKPSSEETDLKMPTIQSARVDMDIIQAAKKFKSKNPSFIIKISHTELTRAATSIPAAFFREHFKKEKEHLNLHSGEKQWPTTLIYYPVKKSAVLSSGWRLFAQENKLKAGDICIFELVYGLWRRRGTSCSYFFEGMIVKTQ